MEKSFKELWQALFCNRQKCPWAQEQNLKDQGQELVNEAQEVKAAIDKNDMENLKEELGDVLWDVLMTGIIAEEQGLFTFKEVLDTATEKLKRRKPWVFGAETVASKEEAIEKWNQIKEKEKQA